MDWVKDQAIVSGEKCWHLMQCGQKERIKS